jgi:hypothetical protein
MMLKDLKKVECNIFVFLRPLAVFILVVSEKNMVVSLQLQKDNWSKVLVHQPEPVFLLWQKLVWQSLDIWLWQIFLRFAM